MALVTKSTFLKFFSLFFDIFFFVYFDTEFVFYQMVRISRYLIIDHDNLQVRPPSLDEINLRWIFKQNSEEILQFLAYHGLIKNQMECKKCFNKMSLQKKNNKKDGFLWNCSDCSVNKSIRDESFFHNSILNVAQMWTLIYMWTEDFRNKNAIKELGISNQTCVNWFNYCRTQCVQQQKIGGVNVVVEMDETCWVKQKHNRGKPKKGCSKWFFGAVERKKGGQAFCTAVKDRKKKTLYKLIKKWIRPGSVIISDEWPAYLKLSLHLPQYEHMLIRHKKSTGGGFSKIVMLPDGTEFNVNTNKCEGLWAQLKQKTKRIHGTSTNLTNSYMCEQIFRLNARAKGKTIINAFCDLLRYNYTFIRHNFAVNA